MRKQTRWAMSCLLAALPQAALGLDCAKPGAGDEEIICADTDAKAAEEAMAGAYRALAARLPAAEDKALAQSQRRWSTSRTYACDAEAPASMAACLRGETERRKLFLEGRSESGPGSGHKLIPVIIEQTGDEKLYDLDVALLKYVDPVLAGEKLFNAQIDALLKEAPSVKPANARPNLIYTYQLDLHLAYASPEFLSAHLQSYDFSGGAHGNSAEKNINIAMVEGRLLGFSDLFEAAALPPLEADCLSQIEAQKATKLPDEKLDAAAKRKLAKAISASLGALEKWSFSAAQAEVTFDAYELGAYVEGSYTCSFSAEALRPFRKLDYIFP